MASLAEAATFTVNSTADAVDASPGNGVWATSGGVCTLRAAIQEVNALAGNDQIHFNIPSVDPGYQTAGGNNSWWRITPNSVLPDITANGTLIDGTTQTTNQGDTNSLGPEIEIDGNSAITPDENGITLASSNSTVRGLVINRFGVDGIAIASGSGNTIQRNSIFSNNILKK